nr:unnamed protein product [Callosobruchus analis]
MESLIIKHGSYQTKSYLKKQFVIDLAHTNLRDLFQKVHIGHTQDLGHLTLSEAERKKIVPKISSKIPFETITDEVREESIAENKFERFHLLKKIYIHLTKEDASYSINHRILYLKPIRS